MAEKMRLICRNKEGLMKIHKYMKGFILVGSSSLLLASCGFMEESEVFLPGERSHVLPTQDNLTSETSLNSTAKLPGDKKGNFGENISQLWAQNIGFTNNRYNTQTALPFVKSSRIYTLNNDSEVTALSESGNVIWKARINPEGENRRRVGGGLSVSDAIYVGTGSAQIVKLNDKGDKVWATNVDAPVRGAPTILNGVVYGQTAQGKLFALNANDGKEKWRYEIAGATEGFLGNSQPILHGNKVISFFNNGRITALNIKDGSVVWDQSLFNKRALFKGGSPNAPRSEMKIVNGQLIAASAEGQISSLNPNSGKMNWSKNYGAGDMEIVGSTIYVIDENDILRAVSASNGTTLWSVGLQTYKKGEEQRGRVKWFGPAHVNGQLYVLSNQGNVIVFSTSGKALRGKKFNTQFSTSPVAGGNAVYVFGNKGHLTAIR